VRRIESTRKAIADFDAIYDFIAKENPRAATDVLRALDRSIQLLADQPKFGGPAQPREDQKHRREIIDPSQLAERF
jgi:plasmid stabilization system protein ParE